MRIRKIAFNENRDLIIKEMRTFLYKFFVLVSHKNDSVWLMMRRRKKEQAKLLDSKMLEIRM